MNSAIQPLDDRRFRLLEALDAIRKLLRDKDDTTQVFRLLGALRGRSSERAFKQFKRTPTGRAVLAERRDLPTTLSNRAALAAMPEGSLGQAFLAFMDRCGLTPEGLVDAARAAGHDISAVEADFRLYIERVRAQHDLWHVVTGYGCDGFGEVCLVAYSWRQIGNLGFLVIAVAGAAKYAKLFPGRPVWKAMLEGLRRGGKGARLANADWEALLPLPLDEVRRQLGIPDAPLYTSAPDVIEATLTLSPAGA
jgi:ubiquinone biosynthesis protein COQ4